MYLHTTAIPNTQEHSANGSLIDLRAVTKIFESGAGTFTAIQDIDLQVDAGEFVAVIGKSGSGKSTLLNMIAGIDHPTSGEVLVNGSAIHHLSEDRLPHGAAGTWDWFSNSSSSSQR